MQMKVKSIFPIIESGINISPMEKKVILNQQTRPV
jgi:hypothetical protein